MRCSTCGSPLAAGVRCGSCGASNASTPTSAAQVSDVVRDQAQARQGFHFVSHRTKLGIFLAWLFAFPFGGHRIYLGHYKLALAQLGATIGTCGLGLFWGLIDGLLLLAGRPYDVDGREVVGFAHPVAEQIDPRYRPKVKGETQAEKIAHLDKEANAWLLGGVFGLLLGYTLIAAPFAWYFGARLCQQYRDLGVAPGGAAQGAKLFGIVFTLLTAAAYALMFFVLGSVVVVAVGSGA